MKNLIILALTVGLFGCATKVDMKIASSAKTPAIMKYSTVAVGSISGPGGEFFSAKFSDALSAARFDGKNLYTVISGTDVGNLTPVDKAGVIEAAKTLNVGAIWLGSIKDNYTESSYRDIQNTCVDSAPGGPADECGSIVVLCSKKTLTVSADMSLMNGAGETIYANAFSEDVSTDVCEDKEKIIEEQALRERVLSNLVKKVVKEVAPYEEKFVVELMTNDKGIADERSMVNFENGISFAKERRMDKACPLWEKALERNPHVVSLVFNAALCKEMSGDYATALKMLLELDEEIPPAGASEKFYRFFKIQRLPSELLMEAIERNQAHMESMQKIEKQLNR